MIKVCLVSPYSYKLFHPEDKATPPFGGSEVQQYQLGKELSNDKNYEISFVVGDFHQEQPLMEVLRFGDAVIKLHKAIKCYNRNVIIDGILDFFRLYYILRKLPADVYIIKGGGSLAGKVAFLTKNIFKKKFIYSSAHDRDSNLDFFKKRNWIINALFRYALNQADTIICQHTEQKIAFKDNLGLEAVVIKSMYSIEDELQLPNYESREYVLWVSRLEGWKQPEIFVSLARRFPNEKFVMITNSDAIKFKNTVEGVANLMIVNNVPFESMDDYFKKAKVFINTSVQEGFPNTFVQALKNKTPIVSFNVNPGGMLERYGMGTCSNGDLEKLSSDVEEILSDRILWRTMSENAYFYAKRTHDIHTIVEEFKNVFETITLLKLS